MNSLNYGTVMEAAARNLVKARFLTCRRPRTGELSTRALQECPLTLPRRRLYNRK